MSILNFIVINISIETDNNCSNIRIMINFNSYKTLIIFTNNKYNSNKPGPSLITLLESAGPPKWGIFNRSNSSPMPTSPIIYTFFPLARKFVCSKYAAAAKLDENISSSLTFNPSDVNFFLYPFLDLVELLVTTWREYV